ncbi:MAG: hypothetical protein JWO69_1612 [Thermoleophilia bacterium]|nr:hypothetical protein [Thermoleophilia bacterium]
MRLGGDRDLDDLVMIAADDVDDVDVAVEVPDGPYTDYWGLCLGYMDVELMREQYASEDVTYCEKSGIVVLELPVADELFLSVGNRSAMRPEVRTYVEALIGDLPGALAADTWPGSIDDDGAALISAEFARFVDQQRELGVQPLY